MAVPIPPLSFTDAGMASASGAPVYGAPAWAGGGVWNVATSGSRASNSGSASNGVPADDFGRYLPWAMAGLAALIAWKLLRK